METAIAFIGKDYVMFAGDAKVNFSIMVLTQTDDKILELSPSCAIVGAGDPADRPRFCDFIARNVALLRYKNGFEYDTQTIANFARTELAKSIRKAPFKVDSLIGGLDNGIPSLYYLDYLGTLQNVKHCAHGYGGFFSFSIFDNYWKPDMSIEEGKLLMKLCIYEVQKRLVINQNAFIVKILDKNGLQKINID